MKTLLRFLSKMLLIYGIIVVPYLLVSFSIWFIFFMLAMLILAVALLVVIVMALGTELKVFQRRPSNEGKKNADGKDAPRYLKIHYKNIEVSYLWSLNGGGLIFTYEFDRVVSRKIGKVNHVFEYCAGPGFIGFNLLANNLCDRLTLSDVNPKAVEAIRETIRNNHLEDKVTVVQSDCLDAIPEHEQWDLVVGNPPWDVSAKTQKNIILSDPQGRVHEKFFRDIRKFLKPGGSILFIEGREFSNARCFKDLARNNGLELGGVLKSVPFLEIFKHREEYRGIRAPLFIFLRVSLFFRETYFLWFKRKEVVAVGAQPV